jgi:hypothetical protein
MILASQQAKSMNYDNCFSSPWVELMARYSKYRQLPEYVLPPWMICISSPSSSFSNSKNM